MRDTKDILDEIDRCLDAPLDPDMQSKWERENREIDELRRKPIAEISAEQAARIISNWHAPLSYADAPEYHRHWWNSLASETQNQINIATEDFADETDYSWRCLTSRGGSVLNASKETLGAKSRYPQLQAALPKITEDEFITLSLAATQRRTALQRGKQRSVVKTHINEHVDASRQVLHSAFSVVPNRPSVEQDRDRFFSKRAYQGMTSGEIAGEWNRQHRKEKRAVTPAGVEKAIERYRKRREPVTWLLRFLIYQTNFPKIAARTCPQCNGAGEIHHSAARLAWRDRRVQNQDWGRIPEDDLEPVCPPPTPCELCHGTGIRTRESR